MFRAIILMIFTYFFYNLHTSGDLSKYINMKYEYISYIAIIIFAVLTIVQIFNVARNTEDEHCCDHTHEKEKSFFRKMLHYGIFIFPLATGLFLPIATLDSTIVKSKGFSFQAIDSLSESDPYAQTQYLRPDTSVYYGKEGYDELMEKELKIFSSDDSVILNDKNYLKGMETIYNFPGEFLNKTVEFKGFTFNGESLNKRQLFVLRFGIIHCIADSGAFGMLVEFPEDMDFQDDEWIKVNGTLSTIYYQPFQAKIPYLIVKDWERIQQPQDPYTYRMY
ncbi:TIGR03943 family putative permease subunit [Bacillus massiliigorillae]|uniref:TIGR03943 family putative permease subunit n=1 Tax=Bacillus massiliigorillae TaxID=1243664 RepID=UPI00039C6848|nr:TIGR03943 family protein [Bacillus massiliigorillae]